jgi:lipopolysaccharide/colanic/teichoic acid biosynthesis glycosyltransferase
MASMQLSSTHKANVFGWSAGTVVLPRMLPAAPTLPIMEVILKRLLDITISLGGILIGLPIMLALGLLIRLDSPGPALFRQLRMGQHGRLFTFYKFRTMWVDAREQFPELYDYHYSDTEIKTMYFKQPSDPRLTHFGSWLRKTSLDELPNLINVLLGHMTLVGPRPEIPEMARYYRYEQLVKFAVKPGATGLAQISGRAALRFQETIACDLAYCEQRSLRFDIWVLMMTIRSVLMRVGAF